MEINDLVQGMLDEVFAAEYSKQVGLEGTKQTMEEYSQIPTNNKILIKIKR